MYKQNWIEKKSTKLKQCLRILTSLLLTVYSIVHVSIHKLQHHITVVFSPLVICFYDSAHSHYRVNICNFTFQCAGFHSFHCLLYGCIFYWWIRYFCLLSLLDFPSFNLLLPIHFLTFISQWWWDTKTHIIEIHLLKFDIHFFHLVNPRDDSYYNYSLEHLCLLSLFLCLWFAREMYIYYRFSWGL